MNLPRCWILVSVIALAVALGGCTSTKTAAGTAPTAPARAGDPFSGRWEGTWRSAVTSHHGRLKCQFTKIDRRHYRADFKAYWSVLSGRYSVVFDTRQAGRELRFSGEHDLGKLYGGVFHYEGAATPERFQATYRSSKDRGVFEMRRVE